MLTTAMVAEKVAKIIDGDTLTLLTLSPDELLVIQFAVDNLAANQRWHAGDPISV